MEDLLSNPSIRIVIAGVVVGIVGAWVESFKQKRRDRENNK